MVDKVIENNRVSILGEIVSEFRFSHEVFGEGFYIVDVAVSRLSDMYDTIPLMVSERLVDVTQNLKENWWKHQDNFVHITDMRERKTNLYFLYL